MINEIKETQINVSIKVSENLNMSMNAIEKYNQLVERYERAEEQVIQSYTALEDVLTQGKQQMDDIFQMILGKLNFVISLEEWFVSQFFDIRAFILYLSFGIFVFIATSFERTLGVCFESKQSLNS